MVLFTDGGIKGRCSKQLMQIIENMLLVILNHKFTYFN